MENNLVRKLAWRFFNQAPETVEFEDLLQEAYLAYLEAKKRYSKEKQAKFTTWAWNYITGYLKNYLNTERKEGHVELEDRQAIYTPTFLFETLSELSKEAQQVCYIVLRSPNLYGRLGRWESKKRLVRLLRRQGWTHRKIQNSFRELKECFREA